MDKSDEKQIDENLEEGRLYVYKDGELKEIETDPDDTMRKVRLMEEAINTAVEVQRRLRSKLGGYKPDLSLVCSSLIIAKGAEPDADASVAKVFTEITRKLTS